MVLSPLPSMSPTLHQGILVLRQSELHDTSYPRHGRLSRELKSLHTFNTPSDIFSGTRWHSREGLRSTPWSSYWTKWPRVPTPFAGRFAGGDTATSVRVWQRSEGLGPEAAHSLLHAGLSRSEIRGARNGMFEGVNDRDEPPFDAACRGITIRIHVGPYVIGSLTITHLASSFRGILPAPMLRGN
jgi:hypothetical protein